MTNPPTVSVVIPTYKRRKKLVRAVNSVINQTYEDINIYVVNDDPTEDVSDVLPNSNSINYIHHDENRGAPVARNNGIRASQSQYIAFLDDDDAWKPTKISKQMGRFEELDDSYGLVYTGRDIIQDGVLVDTDIPEEEGWIKDRLLLNNIIPSETPVVRRECFDTVEMFDPTFESCQDIDLWIRLAEEYKIANVPESLAISYQGDEKRISTNPERRYLGHKRLLEKHKKSFESNPNALAKKKRQIGVFSSKSGRSLEGVNYLLSSYRHNPYDWPILIYIIISLAPSPIRDWLFAIREEVINYYNRNTTTASRYD